MLLAQGSCLRITVAGTFHLHALEKEMATHSSVLAWRIPGTGFRWAAVHGVAQSRIQLTQLSSCRQAELLPTESESY